MDELSPTPVGTLQADSRPLAASGRHGTDARTERDARLVWGVALTVIDQLPLLAERVTARIVQAEPRYEVSRISRTELRGHVQESLRLGLLAAPWVGSGVDAAMAAARITGQERLRAGLPLDALVRAYHIGGRMLWGSLAEAATEQGTEALAALVRLSPSGWEFHDRCCTRAAEAYRHAAQLTTVHRDDPARIVLDRLLLEEVPAEELPRAATALGLPVLGRFVVAVVQGAEQADDDRLPGWPLRLPTGMRGVVRTAGPEQELVVHLGMGRLDDLTAALTAPAGVRVGISMEVQGLGNLRGARRQADLAVRACYQEKGTVRLDERLPSGILAAEPGLAQALVARVLGPVVRLSPGECRALIETFRAWLGAGGSAPAAAAAVGCHRNTVLNRLRRLEELTGHDRADPRALAELVLAVDAYGMLASQRR